MCEWVRLPLDVSGIDTAPKKPALVANNIFFPLLRSVCIIPFAVLSDGDVSFVQPLSAMTMPKEAE